LRLGGCIRLKIPSHPSSSPPKPNPDPKLIPPQSSHFSLSHTQPLNTVAQTSRPPSTCINKGFFPSVRPFTTTLYISPTSFRVTSAHSASHPLISLIPFFSIPFPLGPSIHSSPTRASINRVPRLPIPPTDRCHPGGGEGILSLTRPPSPIHISRQSDGPHHRCLVTGSVPPARFSESGAVARRRFDATLLSAFWFS
jgi:hypothetical protein